MRRAAHQITRPAHLPTGNRAALLAIALPLLLTACHVGPRNFENENDKLRAQNLELTENVKQLQDKVQKLDDLLHTLHPNPDTSGPKAEVPEHQLPRVTTLKFDRLSGPADTDGDKNDDTIRIYLRTLDQFGRFIPVQGRAELQAVALRPGKKPHLLAKRVYEPKQFHATYRTGLTGTHFSLELPLPATLPEDITETTYKLFFIDAATKATINTQETTPLKHSN